MLNEKFFRALFFVVIVSAGVYYFYPTELNEAQRLAYLKSYGVTLGLTIGGTAIGVTLGFILAFLKFLNIKILSFLIDEYVDILRGTPIILQLLIFSVVIFATWSDNFYVALIALGLNSSAYVAEIVRSGINSVDKGQMEAARAMGLNYYVSMREVVFPQATKNILPALANEFISLFKETSVVGYISVIDITMQSKSLQAVFYSPEPVIFTGIVYYVSVKFFTFLVSRRYMGEAVVRLRVVRLRSLPTRMSSEKRRASILFQHRSGWLLSLLRWQSHTFFIPGW